MKTAPDKALHKGMEAHQNGNLQKAYHYYNIVLKANPEHPDANHKMALLSVDVDKFHESLPFFKKALNANPDIAQYWVDYIGALVKFDRLDDAKMALEHAKGVGASSDAFAEIEKRLIEVEKELTVNTVSSKSGEPPMQRLQNLIGLHTKGQFKKVLAEASQLVTEFPKSINLFNIIGAANKSLGNLEEALTAYKKALLLKPDFSEAYYNMGITLQLQGNVTGAIETYKKALRIQPNYAEAYNNMGTALRNQGKREEAIEAYKRALSIKPNYVEVYNNLGVMLQEEGKLKEAINAYKKSCLIKPDYAEAYNNMGTALRDQGKLEEAINAYKKSCLIKPNYAGAYYNLGNIFQDRGEIEEAIEAYKIALSIKPDYVEVYNNLGVTLQEQGKLNEAIEAYGKAISLQPHFAEAHNNIGSTFLEQGKLDQALEASKKALSLQPDFGEAQSNLGLALQEQGKLEEALLAYSKALSLQPDYAELYSKIGVALQDMIFNKPNIDFQTTINSLLNKKSYIRPIDIARAAISLLKFEPCLQENLKLIHRDTIDSPLNVITDLNELALLLKLMSVCPLPDLELEALLINLRRFILSHVIDAKDASAELLNFQSALALQCFTNEYVYKNTPQEIRNLQTLETIVKSALKTNDQPSAQVVLALASYKALIQYEWYASLIVTEEIKEVFTRQVEEAEKENELKSCLPVLEEITDKVSSKVRDQYEKSPYPRWINLAAAQGQIPIAKIVNNINLNIYDYNINEIERPEILIAGCGTGQHSIETATRFKSSKILAIDLSLSSLAYAKRKTEELNIGNIEYMQADILDIGRLNKQFDIIESSGVLHHMENPMTGWKVLTTCLKPGGLMKIGLYSELARQHIVKIREEIKKLGIGLSDHEIKNLRDIIIRSDKDHHNLIIKSNDFYSLSTLRDLLFHVQEHRFNIPLIKDHLDELGLKFCGFESKKIVSQFRKTNTQREDLYDLDKWHAYEKANPNVFAEMYQFWCQKAE